MLIALQWILGAFGIFLVGGTLINLTRHPHWFVRGWDYPRPQTAVIALATAVLYGLIVRPLAWFDYLLLVALACCIAYQLYLIFPYTPLARRKVKYSDQPQRERQVHLLIANVLMENERHDDLLSVIRARDPDIIFLAETNRRWVEHLEVLRRDYPYAITHPQENMYGMALYSRLELTKPEVRFIVQDDVPSIHAEVTLPCGDRFHFHGLHPRPPEPLRDQSATPRDAELVVMGREIKEDSAPVIVAGDLNDVAWSRTTNLFLRLSQLLDPRMGRGFYNTWHADRYFWRVALDHVFHCSRFQLVDLRVLEHIGSDHFPVWIELQYAPEESDEQIIEERTAEDEEVAQETVDREEEEEQDEVDSPKRNSPAGS